MMMPLSTKGTPMQTLDEMRNRHFLSADQHAQIGAWIAAGKTPEAIMQMPPHLWRALELASVLMNVDADLLQPPALDAGP
jgi:ABC-type glycerol-3-phosphate transport system substrate-binding protein